MKKGFEWAKLLVLIIILFSYCSESQEPERCVNVPSDKLEALESGLNLSGGSLRDGWAVKSRDFNNVYFIAAEIDGPGIEGDGDVGLWASNSLDINAMMFSVDSVAQEFSVFPKHKDVSRFDDGAEEAKSCVRRHQKNIP
jgi:hypothetical protein